jgi:hypothetical protein
MMPVTPAQQREAYRWMPRIRKFNEKGTPTRGTEGSALLVHGGIVHCSTYQGDSRSSVTEQVEK